MVLLTASCSNQATLSKRYLAAEQMWNAKNYSAAVSEFDQIIKESPNSSLGLQSLLRASYTRALFLKQPDQALKGFKEYLDQVKDSEHVTLVNLQIGEIYFHQLQEYEMAIQHYQKLIAHSEQYSQEDRFTFYYRIARAQFLLGKNYESIQNYEKALALSSQAVEKAKVELDIALSWYAIGDTNKSAYPNALQALNKVETLLTPKHPISIEAEFWKASTLEELDQLETAKQIFLKIKDLYPAKNVVQLKLVRIEERMKRKRR